ncbi:hypothetical protein ONE63_008071 [Megalurothrips usitatus]|uniref:2-hydroxyacylsphingosine 1-beta-galactosyltransferase-like n=1 Tax=Megalurothrips usitatus TaxID=439358 RepID=A0AAV7XPP2_9NEOP|nr:hypothetical protein ONE63_008071 [Megalurothrips usitatus]
MRSLLKPLLLALLLALTAAPRGCSALNVLLVSTFSSPSHYIWVSALAGGLLQRGHHVTELVIRSPATPHPNRTSFVVAEKTYHEKHDFDLEGSFDRTVLEQIPHMYRCSRESIRTALRSKAFADLKRHLDVKKLQFDVFVIDYVLQEPLLGLNSIIGRKPVVVTTAYNLPEDIIQLMGSPYFPSLFPYGGVGADGGMPMTFQERVFNLYKWIAFKTYIFWVQRPHIEKTIAETFPGSAPLDELLEDVAVSLVNTSPALHGALPLVPGIVEVGGLQARPAKPLPTDILDWIDSKNAPHGFVFMSFGTNVKSSLMSKVRREAILKAFARIEQRVLWKYEQDDILDQLPPNVRVAKWLPQNDILAHPNIRCFVSHNGGLSSQEASYHGVPVLGIPFFVDQLSYAEKFTKLGLGRRVIFRTITEDIFHEALHDVINNPWYRDNMRRVQQTIRDQKETPLERAVWWVEHAARTGGARHLRSPALRLRWYELWMLDVLAAAAVAAALALWALVLSVRVLRGLVGPQPAGAAKRKTKSH